MSCNWGTKGQLRFLDFLTGERQLSPLTHGIATSSTNSWWTIPSRRFPDVTAVILKFKVKMLKNFPKFFKNPTRQADHLEDNAKIRSLLAITVIEKKTKTYDSGCAISNLKRNFRAIFGEPRFSFNFEPIQPNVQGVFFQSYSNLFWSWKKKSDWSHRFRNFNFFPARHHHQNRPLSTPKAFYCSLERISEKF